MTPKQINAEIAKIIGWKPKFWRCDNPDCDDCARGASHEEDPPDFYRSLDACRLFEDLMLKKATGTKGSKLEILLYFSILVETHGNSFNKPVFVAGSKYRAKAFLILYEKLKAQSKKRT